MPAACADPPLPRAAVIEVDGAYGEGGGQLVRTAVALAAVTGRTLRISNVRAKRQRPGLAAQHLTAVQAVAALCDARCDALALGSTAFTFTPGALRGGTFRFDVGTAGSITLVLQALLPVMLCAPAPVRARVVGGTDVRAAPPLEYFRRVFLALLARMGVDVECAVRMHGYYPRGGGEVEVAAAPGRPHPLRADAPGKLLHVGGLAAVAALPAHVAARMRDASRAILAAYRPQVDAVTLDPAAAIGQGGSVVVWAHAEHSVLGAGRVAERGVRAETLGAAVAKALAADLDAAAALDVHAADQVLVHLALAGGGSFTTRALSRHAETAMWLIEQFLPVRFAVSGARRLARVEVRAAPAPVPSQ